MKGLQQLKDPKFSNIGFLGAPFDKIGSFWIFTLLKTLSTGWYGLKYFKIIIFLVDDK